MSELWTQGVGFIGAGAVGSAMARAVHQLGYPVKAVTSKSGTSARQLAEQLPGCSAVESAQQVTDGCDAVFIAVPDDAIKEVADGVRWRRKQDVVHCSGAASVDLLAHAREAGANIGGFHPLQTFPRRGLAPQVFHGVTFGVQADGELLAELRNLAVQLGGRALVLREQDRALYHASAVLACGAVAALANAASGLWQTFSTPQEKHAALSALAPLLQGTVQALSMEGLPAALTGPIARGDVGTVRRHVDALRRDAPGVVALYGMVGLAQIPIAIAKGTCSPQAAEQMERLFKTELARV